jgi:hypothetical protein
MRLGGREGEIWGVCHIDMWIDPRFLDSHDQTVQKLNLGRLSDATFLRLEYQNFFKNGMFRKFVLMASGRNPSK